MVGAADIIANRLWRPVAQKDRPRMLDLRQKRFGIGHAQFQMFGRDTVRQARGGGQIGDRDHSAIGRPAGPGNGAAFECLQMLVHGRRDSLTKGRVRGDQDRLRALVVFGLGEQVQRDPVGVVVGIGDHQNLGRACDHVDAHAAKDASLGGGHIGVAGPCDLVHRCDGLGAIGHGRDSLRAPDAIDRVHTRKLRGQQNQWIDHPARRGRTDHQPLHPRHLRGNSVHQDRGGIAGQPPRHIKPRRRHRPPAPAQFRPGGITPTFVLRALAVVIGTDARGRQFQRVALARRDACAGGINFPIRKSQRFGRQFQFVEPRGQLDHRRVTARAHIGDDGSDRVIDIDGLFALGAEKGCEGGFELGVSGVQELGHGSVHRFARYLDHSGPKGNRAMHNFQRRDA